MEKSDDSPDFVEVRRPDGVEIVVLDRPSYTVGRSPGNDIVVPDRTASSLHAVLQSYGSGWAVRDLGSTNGTFVDGDKLLGERTVRHGAEVRIGETVLTYRAGGRAGITRTTAPERAPALTPRERDVLVALCAPLTGASVFREPASLREIAAELVVSDAAVKQHLAHLYDKFGLPGSGRRRVELANEAIRRGVVTAADVVRNRPGTR